MDQVFWYLNPINIEAKKAIGQLNCDAVIIGGGMAGLSAAQALAAKGFDVILLEKNFCGSGASGKSSGFITPDSEFSLSNLIDSYGQDSAKNIWELITSGVSYIQSNILKFNIDCDYSFQDTLIAASNNKDFEKIIMHEFESRSKLNYQTKLFSADNLPQYLGSSKFAGGLSYGDTFGINGTKYCQAMKKNLTEMGIRIFEECAALQIERNGVKTENGFVAANYILICTDAFTPRLGLLTQEIYHAQTFLSLSEVLEDKLVKQVFPDKPYMVWDTDMIYKYFRLTPDNRLLLGGASLLYTYAKNEIHNSRYMKNLLKNYFKNKFGFDLHIKYMWPGIIGITKDIMPIFGFDSSQKNIFYIVGCAGLPSAATLGNYAADVIAGAKNDFEHYLSPGRKFIINGLPQRILGNKLSFAISNFLRVSSF